jgi:hypothetical protein
MDHPKILHVEENGVEYFTVIATGESGISVTGLSELTEIARRTLGGWLNNLGERKTVKGLESLLGKDLYLGETPEKRGGKVKAVKAEYAYEILEFAAYERQSKKARQTLKDCGVIGLNSFIQSKTNWLPDEYQSSQESRNRINRILERKCPYNALYQKDVCDRAFGWFGCQFYWLYFYFWMSQQEKCDVDKRNPPINGRRKTKIHQWIEPETKERLRDKAIELGALILSARSKQQFIELFQNRYGKGWQKDMFD